MKRIPALLVLIFLLFCFALNAFAADGEIRLEAVQEKNEIMLSLNISENSRLCTTEIYVDFDDEALEFVSGSDAVGAATVAYSPYITANIVENGRLKISYTSTTAMVQDGEICRVSFRAKKDAVVRFEPEIDHAETFDGKHIRSLELTAGGCEIVAEKGLSTAWDVAVSGGAAAVVAVIVIIIIRKR